MKEEKSRSKRKLVYYLALAFGVLLLAAATILTVYFVTDRSSTLAEEPPVEDPSEPSGPSDPSDSTEPSGPSDPSVPDQPGEPSSGETEKFVAPVNAPSCTVTYNEIYHNKTVGWIYRHKAVDFLAEAGAEVVSMADGVVESVSYSDETGNLVVVDHGGALKSYYRFVEPDAALHAGMTISKGQKIGTVAEAYGSERADGTHLHFEIKLNEDPEDPAKYLESLLQDK